MDRQARQEELQELKARLARLESDLSAEAPLDDWPPRSYYTTYHVLAGMVLGLIAASASLLFNIIGAAMTQRHPLELIRVYLTFPLGEKALEVQSGFVLAAGICLYLATGMVGGIPFHLILSRYFEKSSAMTRFVVATVLGLGIWVVNFYGVLSWMQPLLVGGRWIVEQVPLYVAAATHLVFGWTMLLVDQWGRFEPNRARMQEQPT